ncbi:MAG: EAL domain-containing protein [Gammaproteobacteria bacterium]|nr:EAL domain-containing protein [Gammaproteobacteria bacterium]
MSRLLVLEEDPCAQQAIGAVARRAGFEVSVTTDPEFFLDALVSWQPTHLVFGLEHSALDGIELLRELAVRACRADVIVTSAGCSRVLQTAVHLGRERGLRMAGGLPMPFVPEILSEMLCVDDSSAARPPPIVAGGIVGLTAEALVAAVEAKHMKVVYQPRVDAMMRVIGFEALLRWNHPQLGELRPYDFFELAKRVGVSRCITLRAFAEALAWLSVLPDGDKLTLSFNLSSHLLADPEIVELISSACRDAGVAPSRVSLEIKEPGIMHNPAEFMTGLTQLCLRGFSLALDDFGSGYSSLTQLLRMPFSEVKIDRSFVSAMVVSREAFNIVRATVRLVRELGMEPAPVGVDDPLALEQLRSLGCNRLQGYLFAPPMEAQAARRWLDSNREGVALEELSMAL